MDNKNPFEIKFHNELIKLTENLLEIYKSDVNISKSIKKFYMNYKKCNTAGNRSDFITNTVDVLESKIDDIKIQNEFIFSDDYSIDPLWLLPDLDFKQLWKSDLIDVYKKKIIWQSLKNLYLLGCYYVNKQNQHIVDIVNQFKLEHLIKKEIDNDDNSGKIETDIQMLFNELFGKESFIYEIIKLDDIQEIIEEIKTDPMKVIRKYTSNNCQKIKELSHKLYEKIKEKIMKGELSKEKIDKDMEKINKIMDKFKSELPNDPRFKSIFDNIKNFLNIDLSNVMSNNDPSNIMDEINSKLKETCGFTLDDLCNKSQTELDEIIESNTELKNNLSDLTKTMENIKIDSTGNGESLQNFMDILKFKVPTSTTETDNKSQHNDTNELPIIDEKSLPSIDNTILPNLE